MFEVGKKYRNLGGFEYKCLYVNEQVVFFENCNGWSYVWAHQVDYNKWTLVPPEPKRWSTWQNIYPNLHSSCHSSRQKADSNMMRGRDGVIRRDYEQHEGKEPVCVSFVLEKV